MTTPIVDIHCHTFNADDLAVKGFFRRVFLDDRGVVSALAEKLAQSKAPGYRRELKKLNRLLGLPAPEAVGEGEEVAEIVESLEAEGSRLELAAFIESLRYEDPDLYAAAQEVVGVPVGTGETVPELFGIGDKLDTLSYIGKSRLGLTRMLVKENAPATLFTPMLVDMEMWLTRYGAPPRTTPAQQIEMQNKISLISMKGLLEENPDARVHPFVGFDPRREYIARTRVGQTPLELVKEAVESHGFVGVKVYPPMGFRPSKNFTTEDIRSEVEAAAYDEILEDLYRWCEENEVPIAAHCNPTMGTEAKYRWFSSPDEWQRVLERHPDLHINFGHFGGFEKEPTSNDWTYYFAALLQRYPNAYGDTGNHRVHDTARLGRYLRRLHDLMREFPELEKKVMFGSDWWMDTQFPDHDDYVTVYRDAFIAEFDAAAAALFMGGNALSYLGFDDGGNANNDRLRKAYRSAAVAVPPWLAT